MTDLTDPTTEQALAHVRENKDRLYKALGNQFDTVWQALLCLPEDHARKQAALDALQQAWSANGALVELIQDAERAVAAAKSAMIVAREQRDQIAQELEALVVAIQQPWQTDHHMVRSLCAHITEAHNAAFWEALPYDMASMLGDHWTHVDAQMLYELITVDLNEVDPASFGFTPDQLHAWRANLLFFLRAFVGAAHGG